MAASMERRIYMTRGHHTIFPDLYIILVSKSGMRKSAAAKIAINDIMRPVSQFNIISTIKMTAESLYKELSSTDTIDHPAMIFSDELQTFLGSQGFKSDAIGALTILYDSPEIGEWRSLHQGIRRVENANVNLLACTTFNYIGIMLPRDVIECGFAPRVMWITATKPGKRYPWGDPKVNYSLRDSLREDLLRIKSIRGRIGVSKDAYHFYQGWYNNYKPVFDPIMEPYFLRKGTTILKMAMVLAISNTRVLSIEDLSIEESHIAESIKILSRAEKTMASVYNSSMGDLSKNCEKILDYMRKHGGKDIEHAKMGKALYRSIKVMSEFRESIDYLIELKSIKRDPGSKGGKVYSLLVL